MDNSFIIDNLLQQQEGVRLEFKAAANREAIAKTITAFINTQGGDLVIGIDDDKKVVGVENAEKIRESFQNLLIDWIKPNAPISSQVIRYKKKDVILNRIKHQNNPYDGYKLQFLIKDTVGYKDVSSIYISNQWQKLVGDANNPPKWFDYLDQIDMNGDGFRDLVAGRASYDSKGLVNGPPIYQVPVWLWDKQTKTYKDTLITKMR
jgi:hypothetical protein